MYWAIPDIRVWADLTIARNYKAINFYDRVVADSSV
jgi:hypothetical protein